MLYVGTMYDLIRDVISHHAWSYDIGKL